MALGLSQKTWCHRARTRECHHSPELGRLGPVEDLVIGRPGVSRQIDLVRSVHTLPGQQALDWWWHLELLAPQERWHHSAESAAPLAESAIPLAVAEGAEGACKWGGVPLAVVEGAERV